MWGSVMEVGRGTGGGGCWRWGGVLEVGRSVGIRRASETFVLKDGDFDVCIFCLFRM